MRAKFTQHDGSFSVYLLLGELEKLDLPNVELRAMIENRNGMSSGKEIRLRYSKLRLPTKSGYTFYEHKGTKSFYYAAFLDYRGEKILRENGKIEITKDDIKSKIEME